MRLIKQSSRLGLGLGVAAMITAIAGCNGLSQDNGSAQVNGSAQDDERLYTVLNPTGMPPPIQRRAMTPRPESLEGKTIYLVDETFNDGDIFLLEMQKWFAANMPEVKTEFRVKGGGSYTADDPALWQEIQAEGGLMVLAIGH